MKSETIAVQVGKVQNKIFFSLFQDTVYDWYSQPTEMFSNIVTFEEIVLPQRQLCDTTYFWHRNRNFVMSKVFLNILAISRTVNSYKDEK